MIRYCIVAVIISLSFSLYGCKEDYDEYLLVQVSGTISGELPSSWSKPMAMAHYPKFSRQFGTNMYGKVEGASWYVFVEKNSDVQLYLFNDENANDAYDWPYEPRIPASLTVTLPLTIGENDKNDIVIPIRKVSGSIANIPSFFNNPIVALVYPDSNGWPTLEAYSPVYTTGTSGTFEVYGAALPNYKLWIINDANNNGVYDYTTREPYVTIPEREAKALDQDTKVINLSSSYATIETTLGSLEGSIDNQSSWNYPQAALYQGWDIMAYNPLGDTAFSFCMVDSYKINSGSAENPSYYILLFDDDNPHDGIYIYDDEHDEVNQGPAFDTSETGITRHTNE